jgi:uncharacterized membrane protein
MKLYLKELLKIFFKRYKPEFKTTIVGYVIGSIILYFDNSYPDNILFLIYLLAVLLFAWIIGFILFYTEVKKIIKNQDKLK